MLVTNYSDDYRCINGQKYLGLNCLNYLVPYLIKYSRGR